MSQLPMKITARPGNWLKYIARQRAQKFKRIKQQVFLRDKLTCQYCAFQSDKFMKVVNHDQNYHNNTLSNLKTACSFCAQCFFLDSCGLDGETGGTLIHLPEMTQAELNHCCRLIFVSMERNGPQKSALQNIYLSFKDRADPIEKIFGKGTSNPTQFGQILLDANLKPEQLDHRVLNQIRLLPSRQPFKKEVVHWTNSVYQYISL